MALSIFFRLLCNMMLYLMPFLIASASPENERLRTLNSFFASIIPLLFSLLPMVIGVWLVTARWPEKEIAAVTMGRWVARIAVLFGLVFNEFVLLRVISPLPYPYLREWFIKMFFMGAVGHVLLLAGLALVIGYHFAQRNRRGVAFGYIALCACSIFLTLLVQLVLILGVFGFISSAFASTSDRPWLVTFLNLAQMVGMLISLGFIIFYVYAMFIALSRKNGLPLVSAVQS